jgi:hypothetical protein
MDAGPVMPSSSPFTWFSFTIGFVPNLGAKSTKKTLQLVDRLLTSDSQIRSQLIYPFGVNVTHFFLYGDQ